MKKSNLHDIIGFLLQISSRFTNAALQASFYMFQQQHLNILAMCRVVNTFWSPSLFQIFQQISLTFLGLYWLFQEHNLKNMARANNEAENI